VIDLNNVRFPLRVQHYIHTKYFKTTTTEVTTREISWKSTRIFCLEGWMHSKQCFAAKPHELVPKFAALLFAELSFYVI
jgi:hypothetical protein